MSERPITQLPPLIHPAAKETVGIVKQGFYVNSENQKIDVSSNIAYSIDNSKMYTPDYVHNIENIPVNPDNHPIIEVTSERTLEASLRLINNGIKTAALNFASARNPGGGFAGKNEAQEENLCRSSALYWSQIKHPEMYAFNRNNKSLLYSDYMIFTPDCPCWRLSDYKLLDEPFSLSFITAPAANMSKGCEEGFKQVMLNRARKIVLVAVENGMKGLVLGAWGCGVFKNRAEDVASYFKTVLIDEGLGKYFDHIVFPIEGPKSKPFKAAFGIK